MRDLTGFLPWIGAIVAVSAGAAWVAFQLSGNSVVAILTFGIAAWLVMHLVQRKLERDIKAARGVASIERATLILEFALSDSAHGTLEERAGLQELAAELSSAVEEADAGEYDGDEFGGGLCRLFFFGESCDALDSALQAALSRTSAPRPVRVSRIESSSVDPRGSV